MTAKTTSGSGFDPKIRLVAPSFLLESGFVAVYRQVLSDFTLRAVSPAGCLQRYCTRCDIVAFISQKLNKPEKRNFPRSFTVLRSLQRRKIFRYRGQAGGKGPPHTWAETLKCQQALTRPKYDALEL